jgi:metal-sulfur cluster biosynthetic enzyme
MYKGIAVPTKEEVLEALANVIDPEIGLNIVDVGLIYRVECVDDKIEIDFTLTTPGCPLAGTIMEDIHREVRAGTGVDDVEANLVWDPPWNLGFMSEEARVQLGYPV